MNSGELHRNPQAKGRGGGRKRKLFLFLACLLLAVLGAAWELQLVYGISLSAASLFLLTALRLFGLWAGLAAGATAGAAGLWFGGPVYEAGVLMLEVLFLGLFSGKGRANLARWDFVYWIAVGLPLTYWAGTWGMGRGKACWCRF